MKLRGKEPPVTKRELVRTRPRSRRTRSATCRGARSTCIGIRTGPRRGVLAQPAARSCAGVVTRWDNPEAAPGETSTYLVADEAAALVWAANFGALEWHAWTSRTDRPHQPTYALIDLDPGATTQWEDIVLLARLHRDAMHHLKVRGCPKVTGRVASRSGSRLPGDPASRRPDPGSSGCRRRSGRLSLSS